MNASAIASSTRVRRALCLLLSLILACSMLVCLPKPAQATVSDYDAMRTQVANLEQYAQEYVDAGNNTYTPEQLVAMYIRSKSGRYDLSITLPIIGSVKVWDIIGGTLPPDFDTYCAAQDAANSTDVQSLPFMGDIELPNHETTDAVHMFATMNLVLMDTAPDTSSGDLGGWLGDTCTLLVDVKNASGSTEDTDWAYAKADELFLGGSSFGRADFIADIDGYNLVTEINGGSSYADALDAYFTEDLDEITRVQTFDNTRLAGVATLQTDQAKTDYRNTTAAAYSGNTFLPVLEGQLGVSGTAYDVRRAQTQYVVADYLWSYLPAVTTVAVTPATSEVIVGNTQAMTSSVTGENRPSTGVTWTVTGATDATTTIAADGTLSVGVNETATTLTVTATSTLDATKSGTATVTVRIPSVDSVSIAPAAATTAVGNSATFTPTVDAKYGADATVSWSVTGATSAATTVDANGKLTVGADETATSLTVTATSNFDTTKTASATVTVTHPKVDSITVDSTSSEALKGGTLQMTADLAVSDGAPTGVTWSVSGATSPATTIDANGLLTIGADETASTLTVTATSLFDPTKSATSTITVKEPSVVNKVTTTVAKTAAKAGKALAKTGDDIYLLIGLTALCLIGILCLGMRRRSCHRSER